MSRYRIAYSHDKAAVRLVVHCAGDALAHHIVDALRANGWWVEVRKETESGSFTQDTPMQPEKG